MILNDSALSDISNRIRRVFSATFERMDREVLREKLSSTIVKNYIGIYIHFPFCRSLCPGCPYVRQILREKDLKAYLSSLKNEITIVGKLLRNLDLKVIDVHAGGGTPSLIDREWKEILQVLRENFDFANGCRFGIEANPNDLTEDRVFQLRDAGVDEISIGVQSFFRNNLKLLGRIHDVEDSLDAIQRCKDADFKLINIDMMYLLPGQTLNDWVHDLRIASEQDVDQITCYPLLVPRYTRLYQMMKRGDVEEQPDLKEFKRMYYAMVDTLTEAGYAPLRYYSFGKRSEEYSTVELEMVGPLIGFGAGAMGFTGGFEYVNTCSVQEYIKVLSNDSLPIAGGRDVSKEERAVRWVAERLSGLKLAIDEFEREFNDSFEDLMKRSGYGTALRMGRLFGNLKKNGNQILVTRKGMWSRNIAGWAFVLLIPCRIVEEYSRTPWPLEVKVP